MQATQPAVLVVGAGQAGLALGRELACRAVPFLLVDAASDPGTSWRDRWDSLRLFTPAAHSSLPGFPFSGEPEALPTKDEVADYVAAYCTSLDLPVRWNTPALRLTTGPTSPGDSEGCRYALRTPDEVLHADRVVLATGAFQRPWIPSIARDLISTTYQVHAANYRNPERLPDGPVLVVGSGNSGLQIADELAQTRPTTLACGHRRPYLPQRVLGRNVFRWADQLGLMGVDARSQLGRILHSRGEPVVGDTPRQLYRRRGVTLTGRIVTAQHDALYAADGAAHRPSAVVWATGYAPDFSWVELSVVGDDGWIRQRRGFTDLPGLYTLGIPWQRTNASELIGWVGQDAAYLADAIVHAQRGGPAPD